MNQILSLREKRAKLWADTKAFLDSHRGEDGMVSVEDNATYEKMEADVVALGKEIERLERQAAIDRELDKPTSTPLVSKPEAAMPTAAKPAGRNSDEYKKVNFYGYNPNDYNTIAEALDSDVAVVQAIAQIINRVEQDATEKEIYNEVSNFLKSNI